ncbi:MAG: hypothetical protein DRG78_01690 [Epsilonproteobacteria bacterium]|nr:MAG: hypothetical protein DRG78_01690 [Campylobacterota bacterium]
MFIKTSIFFIEIYQKYLSPHKGYCCAYRVYHSDVSCSDYAKNTISHNGFFKSLSKIKERFKDCKKASNYIQNEYKDSSKKKNEVQPGKFEECGRCGSDACSATACFSIVSS